MSASARSMLFAVPMVVAGYFAGGSTGAVVATADKLVFATDVTTAQTTANLSQARHSLTGCASYANGYFAGGTTSTLATVVATADKLVFATDVTTAQTTANLSQARRALAGCASYANGYFAGGISSAAAATRVATADKLVFATDATAAQTTANLSQARYSLTGCASYANGYFAGGTTSTGTNAVATADKLVFATDATAAQTTANLSQARHSLTGCASYANGYFAGGTTTSTAVVATADKLVFATDVTTAQTTANLSQARRALAGCASYANGYFAGGNTGAVVVTADKLVFATDATAAQTTADLSQARQDVVGCN